eukprot:8943582-Alexandrium_andersonii.AAC.1
MREHGADERLGLPAILRHLVLIGEGVDLVALCLDALARQQAPPLEQRVDQAIPQERGAALVEVAFE